MLLICQFLVIQPNFCICIDNIHAGKIQLFSKKSAMGFETCAFYDNYLRIVINLMRFYINIAYFK